MDFNEFMKLMLEMGELKHENDKLHKLVKLAESVTEGYFAQVRELEAETEEMAINICTQADTINDLDEEIEQLQQQNGWMRLELGMVRRETGMSAKELIMDWHKIRREVAKTYELQRQVEHLTKRNVELYNENSDARGEGYRDGFLEGLEDAAFEAQEVAELYNEMNLPNHEYVAQYIMQILKDRVEQAKEQNNG
jgi:hypothetical protein